MATTKKHPHEVAESFVESLADVRETAVPVMSRDRHIPRKERARLVRELFKRLGLKGVSVTTPNYSMACTVDVTVPKLEIHSAEMWPHGGPRVHESGLTVAECDRCPTCVRNRKSAEKIEEILARAFPNNDDRSDTQSDYFDYCWSVD